MKQIVLLLLFNTLVLFAYSQRNYQDVVYLKNGGIPKGVIIEQTPKISLKIETIEKNVFAYQISEIEKIAKELKQNNKVKKGLSKGYKGIIEVGYQLGIGSTITDNVKINLINGYQYNPYFSLGIGIGFRVYLNKSTESFTIENNLLTFPIFADIKFNLLDKKASPFISLSPGYSFNLNDNFLKSGFIFGINSGFTIITNSENSINIGVGLENQEVDIIQSSRNSKSYKTISLNTFNINFGVTF